MTSLPLAVTAGTTLRFKRSDKRFPASAGWQYTLVMRVPGYTPGAATVDGDGFVLTISASDTADWPEGTYAYSERVELAGEVHELGSGTLTVRPNLASAKPGDDGLTHNQRTLRMLEAAIEGRVIDGIENYSIAGRAVSKLALTELVKLRDKYKMYVVLERRGGRLGSLHANFGGGLQ